MIASVSIITFTLIFVYNNIFFMSDFAAVKKSATKSATNLFSIMDSIDEDTIQYQQKSKMIEKGNVGYISFLNVNFKHK